MRFAYHITSFPLGGLLDIKTFIIAQGLFYICKILARACGVSVGQPTGNVSGHYIQHSFLFLFFFFFFSFSVVYFSQRRSAWIKNLIWPKLTGAPKNLGNDTFPDTVVHFCGIFFLLLSKF